MNAIVLKKAVDVAAPTGGDRGGAKGVFQDQVPSDDPGKNLAQGRVTVGVGGTGDRNQRREFRIAKASERTRDARKNKGKHDGGSGVLRGRRSSQDKNARPDDGADAERNQVRRAQRPL